MGLATFIGGIHPYEGIELSENKPVQVLMPKGDLVYPMSQHIGAPAKPGWPEDWRSRRFHISQCHCFRIRNSESH